MPRESLRILLVEDNADDALLFERGLARRGAALAVAPRLQEALEQLRLGAAFDVVVTDLALPDSNGFQTVERLRATAPWLPLVVLTGRDDEGLAADALREGAEDYLVKGELSEPVLFRTLRHAIERKRSRDQLQQLAESLSERNEVMRAELETAREVQRALLPGGPSFLEGRIRVHQRYIPTQAIGGDLFALVPSGPDETTLAMFDVVGHGVRAALVASLVRALVSELPFQAHDPARLLEHLSQRLRAISTDHLMLATAFCVVLRPEERTMRFASAGHPTAFRIDPEHGAVEPIKAPIGPPLGMDPSPGYQAAEAPLAPSERVFLYTDGLYEVPGPSGEFLGRGGLEEILRRHAREPAGPLADKVLQEVQRYAGTEGFDDDVCIAVSELVP